MIRNKAWAVFLAASITAAALTQATYVRAATKYDGSWSLVIYTKSGPCDAAYRFAGQIVDGNIYYGAGFANLTGRVRSNGSAFARVSSGSNYAVAYGRMTATRGAGKWRSQAPSGFCTGTWVATRY